MLLNTFLTARTDLVVPAQTLFGPAAFVAYLWMRRHYGRERTMQEFLASADVVRPASVPVARPAPVLEPLPRAVACLSEYNHWTSSRARRRLEPAPGCNSV